MTFYKRPGTTDKGKDYEDLTIARFVLRFLTDKKIHDFKLSSNAESFGAFDDVIVEIEQEDNIEEKYALQLKHVNRGKTLTLKALGEESGNYSIKKYFKSYQEFKSSANDYKMILVTNSKFEAKDGTLMEVVHDGNSFQVILKRCPANLFLNMSQKSEQCYKFEIVKHNLDATLASQYQVFFEIFYLYPNQENVDQVKSNTLNHFREMFDCNDISAENYLQFISNWSIKEGIKDKLTKEMMQRVITLQLLSPFIQPLSSGSVDDNLRLLRETISNQKITIFSAEALPKVQKLWGDLKNELTEEEINILCEKYQIPDLDDNLSKLLWLSNKCPLIISTENLSSFKSIDLCSDQHFVLCGDNSNSHLETFSTFHCLSDLEKESNLRKAIQENFKFSTQGKQDSCIQDWLKNNPLFETIITTDELIDMANGTCRVGEEKEKLPEPYITRLLSKNIISLKLLESVENNTGLIIANFISSFVDEDILSKFKVTYFENDTTSACSAVISTINISKKPRLFITETECPEPLFKKLCTENKDLKNLHHFNMIDDGNLEWIRSRKGVTSLEQHLLEDYFTSDSELCLSNRNNINIIDGEPGMGKSILLKYMKNNFSSWTILLSSHDISLLHTHLKQNHIEEFTTFLLDVKFSHYKNFEKKFLKMLIMNGQVVYFWDALDEVAENVLEDVGHLIVQLSENSLSQWITCRFHLKKILMKKFGVLSQTLTQFNIDQQMAYIQERLMTFFSDEDIEEIIVKTGTNIASTEACDVLSIPLQMFMFTELFRTNPEKYRGLIESFFSATDLYYYFIEEAFRLYFRDKANLSPLNHVLEDALNLSKKIRIENYEKLSMQVLFGSETLLDINCVEFLEEIKEEGDGAGFILGVSDGIPIFTHNTYLDYFAACYLFKHLEGIFQLRDLLFKTKYTNVRFFFDLLMAKNCPAHIAVLHKNFEALKKYESEVNLTDAGGRNTLHLACAWGVRYPILKGADEKNYYVIDNSEDEDYTIKTESSAYIEMLNFLLERCDTSKRDRLFLLNPESYAEKLNCLVTLVTMKRKGLCTVTLTDFIKCSILYYSVKFGDAAALELFKTTKYIVTTKGGRSLLHLAVIKKYTNCVQKLLFEKEYRRNIDWAGHFGTTTPLSLACLYGHEEIVALLLKYGANVNNSDHLKLTPLHLAVANGHYKIMIQLIDHGAGVNAMTKTHVTSLLIASDINRADMVEYLLISGADSNIKSKEGVTPLCIASENGYNQVVEMILNFGSDPNIPTDDGRTPLHLAAYNGHEEVAQLLIHHKANVNSVEKKFGYTALHVAAAHGHPNIINLLLKSQSNPNILDKDKMTPLYLACQNGHVEVVKLLLAFGANPNIRTASQITPLSMACSKGHYQIVDLLLKSGAENNFTTKEGFTPLYVATSYGEEKIVHRLLKSGVDPNIGDRNGWRPLHVACFNGSFKIVKMLIAYKAKLRVVTTSGATPLHVARGQGHEDIARYITSVERKRSQLKGRRTQTCEDDTWDVLDTADDRELLGRRKKNRSKFCFLC